MTCRKLTGSLFSATANWTGERFSYTGELRTFEQRSFCPVCGSTLFYMLADGAEVFLGTLDEAPHGIIPMVEVWTIRREHWLPAIPGARTYEHDELRS